MTLRAGDPLHVLLLARARALLARLNGLLERVTARSPSRRRTDAARSPLPPRVEQFRVAVAAAANRCMRDDPKVILLLRALERDGYQIMTAIGVAVNYQAPERALSAEFTEADRVLLGELGIAPPEEPTTDP